MTKEKRGGKKTFRRREGVALVMALGIVLVGSIIVVMIYDVSFLFAWRSGIQQNVYMNHTTMISAIQAAKGYILQTNSDDPNGVMHVSVVMNSGDAISSVNDLRFSDAKLSYDRTITDKAGRQILEMRVYDMFYEIDKLEDSLTNDTNQMKELPPPIRLPGTGIIDGDKLADEGKSNIVDKRTNEGFSGSGSLPLEKYGAYLVRVSLYDVDPRGGRKLVRTAEEAFVQVLD
ncbi:MAG: hypothetical protein LBS00_12120 [Synergistaceae bacterium]|nr:hypothetical protein [Synergistaceae bacterium]